jgi:hypothetical protein
MAGPPCVVGDEDCAVMIVLFQGEEEARFAQQTGPLIFSESELDSGCIQSGSDG